MKPKKISVVIPTYNRIPLLKRCLKAVIQQHFPKDSYEIVVVDDGNSKTTKSAVIALRKQFSSIRYFTVPVKQSGPAKARNIGWKNASCAIIAFTDDDTIPDTNWLQEGYKAFKKKIDAVAGTVIVPLSQRPTDYEMNTFKLSQDFFVTANCFFRKKVLEDINGFDEQFPLAWREDSDLLFKTYEKNKIIIKSPKAVVIHPVREAPWGVSILEQKKSMFNALLYKKHPYLYRKTIQKSPPWRYYSICISFIVALISFIFHYYLITGAMGSIWLIVTFSFFLHRLAHTSYSVSHIAEMFVTSLIIPFLSIYYRLSGAVKYRVFFL